MKRFLIRVIAWGLFCVVVSFAFPYYVDPYNVFHIDDLRDNGVEPNKNYIKMSYILEHPDDYDSFLFGSSRAGIINTDNIPGCRCYNLYYSEGLPAEHLDNIRTLIQNGVDIKRIYIGVDSISYTIDPKEHKTQPMRMPYEYLKQNPRVFYSTYLNSGTAFQAMRVISKKRLEDQRKSISNLTLVDDGNLTPSIGNGYYMDECLSEIADIKRMCDQSGCEVVFFTNPMYKVTYEASVERGYYEFLERLAAITDYYNFSGLNEVTLDPRNYIDTSHYKEIIGDVMLKAMCEKKIEPSLLEEGFGVHVTKDNIDELICIIKQADKESMK